MKRLEQIVQALEITKVSNGEYYSLNDLQDCLNGLCDEEIQTDDCILVPYYIFRGKVLELYEYELTIVVDKTQSFEEYILKSTGRSINNIPDDIMERKRICYIECRKDNQMLKVDYLKDYVRFLLSNSDVQAQIRKCYGFCDVHNMFVEMY